MLDMSSNQCLITLGSSKLSDYSKLSVLGKGTYGEVHKCVHNPTGMIIAMKTFLFEVRILSNLYRTSLMESTIPLCERLVCSDNSQTMSSS